MDRIPDTTRLTPLELRAELDRSRDDLTANRVVPLGSVLAAMYERASCRIENHEQAEATEGQGLTELG